MSKMITKDCPTQIKDAYHYADTNNLNHEHSFQIFRFCNSVFCRLHGRTFVKCHCLCPEMFPNVISICQCQLWILGRLWLTFCYGLHSGLLVIVVLCSYIDCSTYVWPSLTRLFLLPPPRCQNAEITEWHWKWCLLQFQLCHPNLLKQFLERTVPFRTS